MHGKDRLGKTSQFQRSRKYCADYLWPSVEMCLVTVIHARKLMQKLSDLCNIFIEKYTYRKMGAVYIYTLIIRELE